MSPPHSSSARVKLEESGSKHHIFLVPAHNDFPDFHISV